MVVPRRVQGEHGEPGPGPRPNRAPPSSSSGAAAPSPVSHDGDPRRPRGRQHVHRFPRRRQARGGCISSTGGYSGAWVFRRRRRADVFPAVGVIVAAIGAAITGHHRPGRMRRERRPMRGSAARASSPPPAPGATAAWAAATTLAQLCEVGALDHPAQGGPLRSGLEPLAVVGPLLPKLLFSLVHLFLGFCCTRPCSRVCFASVFYVYFKYMNSISLENRGNLHGSMCALHMFRTSTPATDLGVQYALKLVTLLHTKHGLVSSSQRLKLALFFCCFDYLTRWWSECCR